MPCLKVRDTGRSPIFRAPLQLDRRFVGMKKFRQLVPYPAPAAFLYSGQSAIFPLTDGLNVLCRCCCYVNHSEESQFCDGFLLFQQ